MLNDTKQSSDVFQSKYHAKTTTNKGNTKCQKVIFVFTYTLI